jgi:hypothetical protein
VSPKSRASAKGRMLGGRELWDRSGDAYTYSRDLDRAEVQRLLRDLRCQVAIHMCGGPLRWIEVADRQSTWSSEISPNLHDVPNWKPPRGAPGQLPFVPELWTNGKSNELLLFYDHD